MTTAIDDFKLLQSSNSPTDKLVADYVAAYEGQTKALMDTVRALKEPRKDGKPMPEGEEADRMLLLMLGLNEMAFSSKISALAQRSKDQMFYLLPDKRG